MRYFRVADDFSVPGRWYLDEPVGPDGEPLDARIFTRGKAVDVKGPFVVPVDRAGVSLSFTLAAFDMPVVEEWVGAVISGISPEAVQRFSVAIQGCAGRYEILNAIQLIPCFDEERSELTKWGPDARRPDKSGKLRMVVRLAVDPSRVAGHHIFRVQEWPIALVVSERLAELLGNISGITFLEV